MDLQEFPKWKYKGGMTCLVHDRHEESDLGDGWFDTPWEAKGEKPEPILPPGIELENIQNVSAADIKPDRSGPIEFPKWVTPKPGADPVLVQNAAEERALMASVEPAPAPAPAPAPSPAPASEPVQQPADEPVSVIGIPVEPSSYTVAKGPRGLYFVKDSTGANVGRGYDSEEEANAAKADLEASNAQG